MYLQGTGSYGTCNAEVIGRADSHSEKALSSHQMQASHGDIDRRLFHLKAVRIADIQCPQSRADHDGSRGINPILQRRGCRKGYSDI